MRLRWSCFAPIQFSQLLVIKLFILLATLAAGNRYYYQPQHKQFYQPENKYGENFWNSFECFDRIGIGKRLNATDVNRTSEVKTSRECEMQCDIDRCQAYAFGIGASGNGTCEISNAIPAQLPVEDLEYDLYTRNNKCKNRTSSCFRRMAPGRRLMDRYVRKTLRCESLRQCEEDCAQEWTFFCEGFNFRFDARGSVCQLTSVPSDKLMIIKDFNSDREWDFFEREKDAPKSCYKPWSGYRPWNQYGISEQGGQTWHRQDKPPPFPPSYHHSVSPAPAPIPPTVYQPSSNWGFSSGDYGTKNNFYGVGNSYYGFKDTFATGEGFQNSLQPVPQPPVYTSQHSNNECFVRRKVGFRLDRKVVVLSLTAPSLYHCELECANEKKFVCNIFSYRYAYSAQIPGDNCHLGERDIHTLDIYTDLLPDMDYDLYVRNERGPPVCIPRRISDSDCFERVRSGLRLDKSMIKLYIIANSISDCEQACINSQLFTCRAFTFRYGSPVIGQERENCQLTDYPLPELNPLKHFIEDPNCELYHRGSYGHGCELDKWGYYQPPPSFNKPNDYRPSYYVPPQKHGFISTNYDQKYKPNYPQKPLSYLPPNYYPPTVGAPNKGGYGITNVLAYNPPTANSIQSTYGTPSNPPPSPYLPPTGPSLAGNGGNNLYLPPSYGGSSYGGGSSYNSGFGYQQGQGVSYGYGGSYGHGSSYGYGQNKPLYNNGANFGFGTDSRDKFCYLEYGSPARLTPSAVRSSLLVRTEFECKSQCTQSRETSNFRCASLSYRGNNCELSDIEQRDLRPGIDYNHEAGYWLFSWDFTDSQCYIPPKGNVPVPSGPNAFLSGGMEGTWQRFTVSGQPCKAGTVCTQNRDVGIWSCPTEGLNGDWDYCCRPGHHCGYSHGFNYPWCYVGGGSLEQWRPCSDHYYPYPHSSRPQHWPVAYLHRESPPNITLKHQPSIVDNFLETLRQESETFRNLQNTAVPELQPVDLVADPRKDTTTDESAMTKLWMWGRSKYNLTSSENPTASETTEYTATIATNNNEESSTVST